MTGGGEPEQPRRPTRRRFLAAAAGTAAAGAGALALEGLALEPRRLDVTRHEVSPRRSPDQLPLTFVQVTDLHLQRVGRIHRRLAEEVRRAAPDLAVITGDSVDRRDALPTLDAFLALLDPRLPKYATLGNWEHWSEVDLDALRALYQKHGCRLLVNETAVHEHQGRALAVTGLDDMTGGRPDLAAALRDAPPAPAHLLLAHSPEYRDRLAADAAPAAVGGATLREGVDLARFAFTAMLSGHTHGGQVAIGGWTPMLPRGTGRYVRGWFRDAGGPPLYVSRGIGMSVLPVRLGSTPELPVFRIWV